MKTALPFLLAALAAVLVWFLAGQESEPELPTLGPGSGTSAELSSGEEAREQVGPGGATRSEGARRQTEAGATGVEAALCVVRILDEDGEPIDDAQVWWLKPEMELERDGISAGVLEVPARPEAATLVALAEGYLPGTLELAARTGQHELVLSPAAAIRGTVLVDGELPAEPVRLSFYPETSPYAWLEEGLEASAIRMQLSNLSARTDSEGRFERGGFDPEGSVRVRVPFGYCFRTEPVGGKLDERDPRSVQLEGPGDHTFELARLPVLRGRVVRAEDLSPVEGATIFAQPIIEGRDSTVSISVSTDGRGEFQLAAVPGSREGLNSFLDPATRGTVIGARLEIESELGPPLGVEVRELGPDGDLGTFELRTGEDLHVLVIDEEGAPIEGARASAGSGSPTGTDGRATLTGLDSSTRELAFGAPRHGIVRAQLRRTPSPEDPLVVVLPPGNHLTLRLVDGKGGVPGDVRLTLFSESPMFDDGGWPEAPGMRFMHRALQDGPQGSWGRSSEGEEVDLTPDEQGIARLSCLASGLRLTARVYGASGRVVHEESFSGPANGEGLVHEVTFDREPFEVRGRVVDEAGEPIPGARVRLGRGGGRTDGEGRFVLGPLFPSPESASLEVQAAGHPSLLLEEIQQSSDLDLGDLVLPRGRTIEVEVLEETGAPAVGAEARAYSDGYVIPRSTELEPGLLSLGALPPGPVRIELRHAYRTYSQELAPGSTRIAFEVPGTGALELRIPQSRSFPEGRRVRRNAVITSTSDPELTFKFRFGEDSGLGTGPIRVLPGTYTVQVEQVLFGDSETEESPSPGEWSFEVRAGQTTTLELGG